MKWNEIIKNSLFRDFNSLENCKKMYLKAGESYQPTGDILYFLSGDVEFSYKNYFGNRLIFPSDSEPRFLTIAYRPQLKRCLLTAKKDSYLLSIPYDMEEVLTRDLTILQHLYRDSKVNQLFFLELYKESFVKSNFDIREKVAYFLLENARGDQTISLSKKDETLHRFNIKKGLLYRFLDKLSDEGVIDMKGDTITIKNIKYLETILKKKS